MASVENVRESVKARLTTAAEEIFRDFQKTVVGYEEQIGRQRKLLGTVCKPEEKLLRVDLSQQHVCKKNQERNSRLEPEDPQINVQQVLKQQTDTFMLIPAYGENGSSEYQTLHLVPGGTASDAQEASEVNVANCELQLFSVNSDEAGCQDEKRVRVKKRLKGRTKGKN